jgi:putative ABC transport system permease protein
MMRVTGVLREAWASARSQPVASLVTVLVIVGMTLTVMLTTGRTVGAEQRVLGSIDDVGTRTIQVRAEAAAGLTTSVLGRISSVDGIEWSVAFSSAVDVTNSMIPDGTRVPMRTAYATDLQRLGVPAYSAAPGELAFASPHALDLLGMPDIAGSITTTTRHDYAVAGEIQTPDHLRGFEPVVIVPQPKQTGEEPVGTLVVIVERPDLVAPVADALMSVLAVDDPTRVTIQTSEALAQLRAIVQGQLGTFSRGLVLVTLLVTGLLVAVILYGLVTMRRKDFGRRRALGATRGLIVALLVTQTTILAVLGLSIGLVAGSIALVASGDPLPDVSFLGALGLLTLVTAVLAALAPALLASRREPIRELRVP